MRALVNTGAGQADRGTHVTVDRVAANRQGAAEGFRQPAFGGADLEGVGQGLQAVDAEAAVQTQTEWMDLAELGQDDAALVERNTCRGDDAAGQAGRGDQVEVMALVASGHGEPFAVNAVHQLVGGVEPVQTGVDMVDQVVALIVGGGSVNAVIAAVALLTGEGHQTVENDLGEVVVDMAVERVGGVVAVILDIVEAILLDQEGLPALRMGQFTVVSGQGVGAEGDIGKGVEAISENLGLELDLAVAAREFRQTADGRAVV